jgi:hypothetical protein
MARSGRGARPQARPGATPPGPERQPAPGLRAGPFVALALLAALYCGTGMVQAVDTWWGLAAGRRIASHGVSDADPFTFSARPPAASRLSPGAPAGQRLAAWARPTGWINQNWLTHLLLYELTAAFGLNALVGFRFAVYLAAGVLLVAAARVHGASLAAAAAAAALALVACRPFAEFRAQELSIVLAAALLLLLAVAVHRAPAALWAVAPLVAVWANVHGGFVYALVALALYAAAATVARRPGGRWAGAGPGGARRAVATAVAAVALAVVASPFRLANLTHLVEITVGPDAAVWRRVNEWLPALGGGRLGEVAPFLAMAAATAAALAATSRQPRSTAGGGRDAAAESVDLGAVLLAAVTVAMALRSRRFVPLAALALAPVLAAAATQALRRAGPQRRSGGPSARAAAAAAVTAAVVAVVAAGWLAVRWNRSYLQPWPLTAAPVSLFERMTWGHRRSGNVGEFLRRNGVAGRAFGFWEEGGFLEWVQRPEAVSGELPLRVLIDGRAQEAFPATIVRDYLELAVGGPAGVDATAERRAPTPRELAAMAAWVGQRLRRDGIWVAFLPTERLGDGVARALQASPDWRVVYRDPAQSILVDSGDARGRRLDAAVASGEAVFPDEAIRELTAAVRGAGAGDTGGRRAALAAAARSWALRPSAAAVAAALQAGAAPELREEAVAFAVGVVDGYRREAERYRNENGLFERASGVIAAASFLEAEARKSGAEGDAQAMATLVASVRQGRDRALRAALWWG